MKKNFLILICLSFTMTVLAQTKQAQNKLSIGPDVAFPLGDFSEDFFPAYGGSITGEIHLVDALNLTLSAGYLTFKRDLNRLIYVDLSADYAFNYNNLNVIPVKTGAKYYFGRNFYAAGELGAAFQTATGGSTSFAYAPALGTTFLVSKKNSLDFGLRYESWSAKAITSSFIGFKAAFAFGI